MATNEPSLLGMLFRPQAGGVQSTQTRTDATRDAQLFSDSLNTAYRDQRTSRPEAAERPDTRSDNSRRDPPERMAANDNRHTADLASRSRAEQLEQSQAAKGAAQEHLSSRQRETLERLEPAQREAIEALEPAQQAQVLDEIAAQNEAGITDETLSAILDKLDPQQREQLLALMQSLTDQAAAGKEIESLVAQIEQAQEAGQVPPELAAWLSSQIKGEGKGADAASLVARLESVQSNVKQMLSGINPAVAQTPGASIAKEGSAALGSAEPGQAQQPGGQLQMTQQGPLSLDGQRERGALLETAKLHNLLAGRGEAVDKPTAGSITALTESLGLANRTPAAQAAQRAAPPVLPSFNQSGWGDAVGQKVTWMARQNITSADIRLDPPDLGSIHVRVTIQNDQAHVSFSSAQPVVREALDQHSARLREMLTEQGMSDVNVDVSDEQSFAESDPRGTGERGSGGGDATRTASAEDENLNETSAGLRQGTISLVDHYA
ncbi:flagellar hook-length control protein FliK [Gilvimarinus agarilyticus]|uniref:flagellar hook-length control protein FliK n=1 Tax=Gilvimarinus agarilyticus TaxID=679259 RepID=UPI00069714FB|nr:flagellar hook-length control protein FliK [Gilvimarinus agarilyticus]